MTGSSIFKTCLHFTYV